MRIGPSAASLILRKIIAMFNLVLARTNRRSFDYAPLRMTDLCGEF